MSVAAPSPRPYPDALESNAKNIPSGDSSLAEMWYQHLNQMVERDRTYDIPKYGARNKHVRVNEGVGTPHYCHFRIASPQAFASKI